MSKLFFEVLLFLVIVAVFGLFAFIQFENGEHMRSIGIGVIGLAVGIFVFLKRI